MTWLVWFYVLLHPATFCLQATQQQSNIPLVNAPECECLAFFNSIDGYRQYSGPANLAGKRIISTECGATAGTYGQTLPDLLWAFKRSLAGSVNNIIIHGYSYAGSVGPPTTTLATWLNTADIAD